MNFPNDFPRIKYKTHAIRNSVYRPFSKWKRIKWPDAVSRHTHTRSNTNTNERKKREIIIFTISNGKKNSVIANENAKRIKRADNKGIYFALGLARQRPRPNAKGEQKKNPTESCGNRAAWRIEARIETHVRYIQPFYCSETPDSFWKNEKWWKNEKSNMDCAHRGRRRPNTTRNFLI